MMDQLYANQQTPNFPANGIAVSSISPKTLVSDPASKKAEPDNGFKGALESTKDAQTKNINPPLESPTNETVEGDEQEFGFLDFLDIINPLQHIPVVSSIYREITGDELKPTARVFGGILFGGPSGFVSAIANSIVEETTGKDIGENIIEAFLGPDETEDRVNIAEAGVSNSQKTASLPTETSTLPANENPIEITQLFSQLSPVAPPAPKPVIQNSNQQNGNLNPETASSGPLQGSAALAALYNDLGRLKTNTVEDLATQSLQISETATTKAALGNRQEDKPAKWFPLSGGNVIIAQASAPPPVRNVAVPESVDTEQPQPQLEALSHSEFSKNLLNGLNKYQELQTQ